MVVVLGFLDMVSWMKQSIEDDLDTSSLGFNPYSELHAIFDGLHDVTRQNSKKKVVDI